MLSSPYTSRVLVSGRDCRGVAGSRKDIYGLDRSCRRTPRRRVGFQRLNAANGRSFRMTAPNIEMPRVMITKNVRWLALSIHPPTHYFSLLHAVDR